MMRKERLSTIALMGVLTLGTLFTGASYAAPILCEDPSRNYVIMDDSQAAGCLGAGTGNINGNDANDAWLTTVGTGLGYSLASKDDAANPFNITTTQVGASGTWSIDSDFWLTNTAGAIAFKFGTGNQPDEWFVFELVQGVSSGNWDFVNVFGKGGGLSHTNLYSTSTQVPEPGTLALLGLGLLGLGLARRSRA